MPWPNMHRIGELYLKYELYFDLSLPITDVCEVIMRPDAITAQLMKTEALLHTGHPREACDILMKLHKEDPANLLVIISLMELILQIAPENKKWLEALARMSSIKITDSPVQAVVLYYRGIIMKQLGLYGFAQEILADAMKRRKDRSKGLILAIMEERAAIYELDGDAGQARQMWEKIYAEEPDNETAKKKLNLE